MRMLDFAYEKAITGVPGLDSAAELARSYRSQPGSLDEQINRLIRWQNTKSASAGFVTGLGGMITLPVTLPANMTSVIFIQIRMIAAIAHMADLDLRDDRVKTLVYVALCGSAVVDILKSAGMRLGTQLTNQMIQKYLTAEVMKAINKAVGFKLVAKFGQSGAASFSKMVPLLGGIVGGSLDAYTTNLVGNTARKMFTQSVS